MWLERAHAGLSGFVFSRLTWELRWTFSQWRNDCIQLLWWHIVNKSFESIAPLISILKCITAMPFKAILLYVIVGLNCSSDFCAYHFLVSMHCLTMLQLYTMVQCNTNWQIHGKIAVVKRLYLKHYKNRFTRNLFFLLSIIIRVSSWLLFFCTKLIFTVIFTIRSADNSTCDIRSFCRSLFCHSSVVKYTSSFSQ